MRFLLSTLAAVSFFSLLVDPACCSAGRRRLASRRRRVGGNNFQRHWTPEETLTHSKRKSIVNLTCHYVEQPLNHFALPRDSVGTYKQRYCVDNEYVLQGGDPSTNNATPVFLYTGNESPLEQYINNTGLMWELAESFHAQVIFIEHRYEGESLPSPEISNCMSYSSSIQALADYASFIEHHLFSVVPNVVGTNSHQKAATTTTTRPVIAFGGSYGGMLSAWIRMKYPNLIAGAIAASAPIWGFPTNFPDKIDTAWQVIQRGLGRPYPPTDDDDITTATTTNKKREESRDNHCASNLLAAWPLIQYLGSSGGTRGRKLLTETFRLCSPLRTSGDVERLVSWGQTPWFDLAEGSFPYPSSYIPFALTHNERAVLPAWPLQAACWKHSELHQDLGVRFHGNLSDVRYTIHYGSETGNLALKVDWQTVTVVDENDDDGDDSVPLLDLDQTGQLTRLLTSVRNAVSIWYNITGDKKCYDLTPAPNEDEDVSGTKTTLEEEQDTMLERRELLVVEASNVKPHDQPNATDDCRAKMAQFGSWGALCCNEEMNLIITEAQGLGRDFLWPPTHPRGTRTHADVIQANDDINATFFAYCRDPANHYGFPKTPPDPWSLWYDTVYGGVQIQSHSNIIFSNGLLDPWSAAGVYAVDPTTAAKQHENKEENRPSTAELDPKDLVVPGLYLQHINDRDLIALIMEYGGHHTDLMYSSCKDPPSIRKARQIERDYIAKWIEQWWEEYG